MYYEEALQEIGSLHDGGTLLDNAYEIIVDTQRPEDIQAPFGVRLEDERGASHPIRSSPLRLECYKGFVDPLA